MKINRKNINPLGRYNFSKNVIFINIYIRESLSSKGTPRLSVFVPNREPSKKIKPNNFRIKILVIVRQPMMTH